jgi:hypothetical protein
MCGGLVNRGIAAANIALAISMQAGQAIAARAQSGQNLRFDNSMVLFTGVIPHRAGRRTAKPPDRRKIR